MSFKPRAIHQFHGGSAAGDAITNGLFYIRDLLHELGFISEIYCEDVAPELTNRIRPAASFPDSPDTVLLLHFSWAIRYYDWVQSLSCRKILVYHNITPTEFFEAAGEFERIATLAHDQLAGLCTNVDSALTPSAYNASELHAHGYDAVGVIPLLFDPAEWNAAAYDADYARLLEEDNTFRILFVGRIVANKCQEDLLRTVAALRAMINRPVQLVLVGGLGAGAEYEGRLRAVAEELELGDCVDFAGKVSDLRLRALYRACDVFLCLSEHEGFCVPIVEAQQFDLPVVAYASCAIPETVGQGGLLLADKSPSVVAATLKVIAEEAGLRRRLALAGRANVVRFERTGVLRQFAAFLRDRLGIEFLPIRTAGPRNLPSQWLLEGPFDSSYSLALVNRSLAGALAEGGTDVGLHSTEGPGDYAPDRAALSAQSMTLWQRGQRMTRPDVVLRNLYPPRVNGMRAPTRLLASWGWEESAVPHEWIDRFNSELNLVTVVSHFVAKVLIDNGLRVPVAIVGNGADHVSHTKLEHPCYLAADGRFRFLHVSSGFPRKGTDILLEAWGLAFTRGDSVTLVIKTFPNPHNDLADQLAAFGRRFPDHAEVIWLNDDICDEEMLALYRCCDALVMPSRGEGFGLPAAEAMRERLPVIATAHGGMLEFCSPETAWLVDYRFAAARTHLGLFSSAWVEPDVDDLAKTLRALPSMPHEDIRRRTDAAYALVNGKYSWQAVTERTKLAVSMLDSQPAIPPLPTVAWITSWNVRCGIASYARMLACEIPAGQLHVLASRAQDLLGPDASGVRRCWTQGWHDDLEELFSEIRICGATDAVFQFNFGFFDLAAFGRLLDQLADNGVRCHVVLHSTLDVERPERKMSLGQIRASLSRVRRLLVHSIADMNNLKIHGLIDNVTLFPHGAFAGAVRAQQEHSRPRATKTIASFGYILPHKGLRQLLVAFLRLRTRRQDLQLLMLNSIYPAPESEREAAVCRRLIAEHPEGRAVHLITDHLPEDEIHARLSWADLIVFPYQYTQESASGAIRFALASGKPVACTPLSIFEDVSRVIHRLPGTSAAALEAGIEDLVYDDARLIAHSAIQAAWLEAHDWKVLSRRLWNMLRSPAPLDLMAHFSEAAAPSPRPNVVFFSGTSISPGTEITLPFLEGSGKVV